MIREMLAIGTCIENLAIAIVSTQKKFLYSPSLNFTARQMLIYLTPREMCWIKIVPIPHKRNVNLGHNSTRLSALRLKFW